MKKAERVALIRLVKDLVKASNFIGVNQMTRYSAMQQKYSLARDEEIVADSITLSKAITSLQALTRSAINEILDDISSLLSDRGIYSGAEALILLALQYCLKNNTRYSSQVISVRTQDVTFDQKQILFVESGFNTAINQDIVSHYRQISNYLKLSSFDFVYIPQLVDYLSTLPSKHFEDMISFMAPDISAFEMKFLRDRFLSMTTASFCKDNLQNKLKMNLKDSLQPSLLVKVGDSLVENRLYSNFLRLEISSSVISTVEGLLNSYMSFQGGRTVAINDNYNINHKISCNGFYKLIFDQHLLRQGVQSSIVIDTMNESILFKDINITLGGVHRREKALYALFLLESESGGIDFNKSDSVKKFQEHTLRVQRIQNKYNAVYQIFGGEVENAPDLSVAEIRLPMISRLKRSVMTLENRLTNVEDYLVKRRKMGVYNVSVDSNRIFCVDSKSSQPIPMVESSLFKKIQML